jgi:hypothetical protein
MMKNEYVGWKNCIDRLNMGEKSRKEGSRLGGKSARRILDAQPTLQQRYSSLLMMGRL